MEEKVQQQELKAIGNILLNVLKKITLVKTYLWNITVLWGKVEDRVLKAQKQGFDSRKNLNF